MAKQKVKQEMETHTPAGLIGKPEKILGPKEPMSIENLSRKMVGRAEYSVLVRTVIELERRVKLLESKREV